MSKPHIITPQTFSTYPDGTEYAEINFGSSPMKGGIIRLPPGTATAPHNHHETELFLLVQGQNIGLGQPPVSVLSRPGDVAIVQPFESHRIVNTGDEVAVLFDLYYEHEDEYLKTSARLSGRQAGECRSIRLVDLREGTCPGGPDILLACYEQQYWPVHRQPATVDTHLNALAAILADRAKAFFRTHTSIVDLEAHRSLCMEHLGRFAFGQETLAGLDALFSVPLPPLDLSLDSMRRGSLRAAAAILQQFTPDEDEYIAVILQDAVLAHSLPAVPLLLGLFDPERVFSKIVFLANGEVAAVPARSAEKFARVYSDFHAISRTHFAGRIPVAGTWNSCQIAAFEEIEAICRRATALADPERFSVAGLGGCLNALLDLAAGLLAGCPWTLRGAEPFDAMLRTNLALVACALRAFTVLFEPCQAGSHAMLPAVHSAIYPGRIPWAQARQLLPEAELGLN